LESKQINSNLENVSKDKGDSWAECENGKLALIILIDQMSRNIYRKQKEAFDNDHIALPLAKDLISTGEYDSLKYSEQLFVCLPFEHSESLEDQEKCIELAQKHYGNLSLSTL
jgi:uncharacterized protein (DUF924 family)